MDTLYFGLSDKARRKNNEDYIAYFEPSDPVELKSRGCLYIVADGVGGAAKGELASQYAAEKILFEYYQPQSAHEPLIEPLSYLRAILERVNQDIYEHATQRNTRMATTIALAVIRGGYLYCANIGDSRVYLIRGGKARQITHDHSLVGEMVQHGEMTELEAMASKIKNRLTRSLGGDPETTVETYAPLQLQDGDKVLLCTDGLTRYATSEHIASMSAYGTPEEIVRRFIKFANDNGGADNVSAILIAYQKDGAFLPPPSARRPHDPESMPTQPGIGDELKTVVFAKKEKKDEERRRQERVWLVILAAAATTLVVIVALTFIPKIGLPALATSTPTPPPFTETPPVIVPPLPPPAVETPTSSFTPAPLAPYVCVYKIEDGDTLSDLKQDKNLPAQPSMYCTISADQKCSIKNEISDPNTMPVGLNVIFDGIVTPWDCVNKGGQWTEDISAISTPEPSATVETTPTLN